jgi:hypothetical protein
MKYTEDEKDFLIENYPKYGGKYCSLKLNRSLDAINRYANVELKISCKNKVIHPSLQKVSISKFNKIELKEVSYFLGYFWADGYIRKYISNDIQHHKIALEIKGEDAEAIMSIMKNIGSWSIQKRKRNKSWQETYSFTTNNKDLYNFLEYSGYRDKSTIEPTMILSNIPNNLLKYFWRGYFDGDGSAGLSGRGSYIEFASTYDYEYYELKKLFNKTNCFKYKIYRSISKRSHKSSVFKQYGKENIKIADYLLSSDIGLYRKTLKLLSIKNKYAKAQSTSE